MLAALHAEAAEEERPCERGAAPFVVVFEGAYVNARSVAHVARHASRELCSAASGLWRRPVMSSFINCFN